MSIKTTQLDPELGLRVEALSRECRSLTTNWDRERAGALYEEADALAERAQTSGLTDLSESMLGMAAYLSSFADSAMRPNPAQIDQLQALAEAVADSLQRYRARIEVAVLSPERASPLPLRPAIHYFGANPVHRESLRTHLAVLGYDLAACTDVHDVEQALEAGSVLALVIGAESLPSWLSDRRTDLDGTVTTRVPLPMSKRPLGAKAIDSMDLSFGLPWSAFAAAARPSATRQVSKIRMGFLRWRN